MEHGKKRCQAAPEAPKLCVNRCGLFGNAATMNLCSKCHKDLVLKQEQAKLSSSLSPLMPDCSSIDAEKKTDLADPEASLAESLVSPTLLSPPSALDTASDIRGKGSPNRCSTCKKRVGLTAFHCRCGSLFCAIHRYSDKHGCAYDYRTAARVAIAKANPVVRAEKLRKI